MFDNLRYSALIIAPHVEDYKLHNSGGGDVRIFGDVEVSRENLLKSCEVIKARLDEAGQGSQSIGIARLKLREDAMAKSHRPREAFTEETCQVIGDLGEAGELLVLVSPPKLDRLLQKVRSLGQRGSAHLTSIESFTLVGTERRFPHRIRSAVSYDIEHYGQAQLKIRVPSFHLFGPLYQEELEQKLLTLAGVEETPYLHQGDFAVYAVKVQDMSQVMAIASLQFIEQLELMPTYKTSGSAVINIANLRLAINRPLDDLPIVAIVDSGIDPNSPLEPLVYSRERFVPSSYCNPSHGTSVAALAAAQEGIVGDTFIPRCRLLDVTVIPNSDPSVGPTEKLYENVLVRRLEEAVQKYSDVKHWNLSLATETRTRPTTFSDLGMELDRLHKLYDVTFYCSPGNYNTLRTEWPPNPNISSQDWVASPGDALCGITVGSCTSDDSPDDAMAPGGAPSPFSPRGPVAYSVVKPDVVEVGGNLARDRFTQIGVNTISRNGEYCTDIGTSFSTPRVCGTSAELAACIVRSSFNQCNPLLLSKTLLLHHASVPSTLTLGANLRLSDFYGFGKPASLEDMIGDPFWRSTSLICGQLCPDGQDIVLEDFPYPDGLCNGGQYWGQVWVTMASEPVVDPSFKTEYARSSIDVHFGVVRQANSQGEKFVSQTKCVHTGNDSQVSLDRNEYRWSPVKQYRSKPLLGCSGDRWRLRVHMTLRDKESDTVRVNPNKAREYAVDVVVAVTIADPTRSVQVSNQMFHKWRARGNYLAQIEVANRLEARFASPSGRF